jgi:nucleotide-binding universal stress UspA family protein
MADTTQATPKGSVALASLRRILVATDYSDSSQCALETAAAVAVRFRSELAVVHVIEESSYSYPFPMPPQVRDAAKRQLDETVANLRARVGSTSGVLREGFAAHEICEQARQASADLVVVGSHGRSGLPRFVHGGVAERVVRLSHAPVLVTHPTDGVPVAPSGAAAFEHIIAPTDFSDASTRGVEAAANLALQLDAALTLVHVYELPTYAYYVSDDIAAEVEQKARRNFDDLLAKVRLRVSKVDGVLRRGNAWARTLDVTKDCGADLIVLSTHGRQGVQRVLIGSVAEKIVRLAPVPVLTVGAI